jgi:ADP-ribose pyrophosphatase YjhB (NUDIX family)
MADAPSLSRFPRPNVAVDVAVLTVAQPAGSDREPTLCVVVQRGTDNRPMLPGRFIRERRTGAETVDDVLRTKLRVSPSRQPHPRLLKVFDDPSRDPRGWTLSIGYSLGLPAAEASELAGELIAVTDDGSLATGEHLRYDHDEILREALLRMRERYEREPDPDGLLVPPFTLSQLRRLHEVVLGEPLRKDTFNRRMKDRLDAAREPRTSTPLIASEGVGRPAQMFTYGAPPPAPASVPYPLPRANDPAPSRSPHRRGGKK